MSDTIITAEQIESAKTALAAAASQGYDAYVTAKEACVKLTAAYDRQQAVASGIDLAERVVVVGRTYRHRDALKRLGLKWSAGIQGWIGTREQVMDGVPAGCEVVSHGAAAVRSMDHADSAY